MVDQGHCCGGAGARMHMGVMDVVGVGVGGVATSDGV